MDIENYVKNRLKNKYEFIEAAYSALSPIDNKISGQKAFEYFSKSNISRNLLAHCWRVADYDKDGCLSRPEFYYMNILVDMCKDGIELPKTCPKYLIDAVQNQLFPKIIPLAQNRYEGISNLFSNETAPSSIPTQQEKSSNQNLLDLDSSMKQVNLGLDENPQNHRIKVYEDYFKILNNGSAIPGKQCKEIFIKSGLPLTQLAKIWQESDIDRDGALNISEFIHAFTTIENLMAPNLFNFSQIAHSSNFGSSESISTGTSAKIDTTINQQTNFSNSTSLTRNSLHLSNPQLKTIQDPLLNNPSPINLISNIEDQLTLKLQNIISDTKNDITKSQKILQNLIKNNEIISSQIQELSENIKNSTEKQLNNDKISQISKRSCTLEESAKINDERKSTTEHKIKPRRPPLYTQDSVQDHQLTRVAITSINQYTQQNNSQKTSIQTSNTKNSANFNRKASAFKSLDINSDSKNDLNTNILTEVDSSLGNKIDLTNFTAFSEENQDFDSMINSYQDAFIESLDKQFAENQRAKKLSRSSLPTNHPLLNRDSQFTSSRPQSGRQNNPDGNLRKSTTSQPKKIDHMSSIKRMFRIKPKTNPQNSDVPSNLNKHPSPRQAPHQVSPKVPHQVTPKVPSHPPSFENERLSRIGELFDYQGAPSEEKLPQVSNWGKVRNEPYRSGYEGESITKQSVVDPIKIIQKEEFITEKAPQGLILNQDKMIDENLQTSLDTNRTLSAEREASGDEEMIVVDPPLEVIALRDFKSTETDFSFKKGDELVVSFRSGDSYYSEIGADCDWFPMSYVKVKEDEFEDCKIRLKDSYHFEGFRVAIYPNVAEEADEITFDVDDVLYDVEDLEEWVGGYSNGKMGIYPKDYTKVINEFVLKKTIRCIKPFTGSNEYELTIEVGEILGLLRENKSGWVLVVKESSDVVGFVPQDSIAI